LNVSFTPTDTTNYTQAHATALIKVMPSVESTTLILVKSAYPTSYDSVGQTITYTYTVTNSGNVNISAPITVADDKFGTVSIQSNGTLNSGSSVTGTSTYKTTHADINNIYVTNLAYVTGSFNSQPVISPKTVEIAFYKYPTNDRDNNGGPDNDGYCRDVGPNYGATLVPVPMTYSNSMFGSEP
jgi:hypothetical protein